MKKQTGQRKLLRFGYCVNETKQGFEDVHIVQQVQVIDEWVEVNRNGLAVRFNSIDEYHDSLNETGKVIKIKHVQL